MTSRDEMTRRFEKLTRVGLVVWPLCCVLPLVYGCGKGRPDPAVKVLDSRTARSWDFDQEIIQLDELSELSADVAEQFAGCSGAIYLNGLRGVDDSTAAALAKTPAQLEMNGLETLDSPELAGKLAQQKDVVFLDKLQSIRPQVAKALSRNRSGLSLNGLGELSEAVAAEFASHQGRLWLGGVRSLPDSTIKVLLAHDSPIYFRDLKEISKKAAKVIEKQWGFTVRE